MPDKHVEHPTPDSVRVEARLNERFDSLAHVLVAGFNADEGLHRIIIADNKNGMALVLNLDGTFSATKDNNREPNELLNGIKLGNGITAEALLPDYAKIMYFNQIAAEVSKTTAYKLEQYKHMGLAPEVYQDLVSRVLAPFVKSYVSKHKVSLMEALVRDMAKAYGPILRVLAPAKKA